MRNMKCDICGGDIERKGNYYVCAWCRNKWEIDSADDVHAVDRANAWSALRDGDFEKATELFENIILKEPKSHEAHWGRALALGGIVYVTDLSENKKVPTCNNITEDSFINGSEVKKAISLAPADIAESYKSQAEYIEKVRVEWLEKARKEPPYDVFISFKDSDRENGIERTQDSIDAQDLYNALVAEGYKVFFSRVSLRDKISEQYEPYIYNAIKTAKVMVVFGEKAEYFSSVWIKNEWSRFKTRIEKGEKHKNSLVVVYKNINPGDLPAVLRSRQCLNASDMTFLSDLNKHIKKVIELSEQNVHLDRIKIDGGQIAKKATELKVNTVKTREIGAGAIAETDISEKQSVGLINTYLRAKAWNEADKLIEDVLFNNPACAEAVWCKILSKNKATDEAAFCKLLSLDNCLFCDFELLEKLLNCSSKDFAAHILDLFYGITFYSDGLQCSVLERILPFNYSGREKKIKEAFANVIARAHLKAFELLLSTLNSDEVDRYVSYNLDFVRATSDTSEKRKCINNVLAVDEGNLEAYRLLIDTDIKDDVDSTVSDFETLLKYTDNADKEVVRVIGILTNENYLPRKYGVAFAKQLLRYYSGNILNLKDGLLKFADKLLKNKDGGEAEYYYNLVLSVDKSCAEAYFGLCLIKVNACSEADVVNSTVPINNCAEFNKYLSLVDEKRRVECIEFAKKQIDHMDQEIKNINDNIDAFDNEIKNLNASNQDLKNTKQEREKLKKSFLQRVKGTLCIFILSIISGIMIILTYISLNMDIHFLPKIDEGLGTAFIPITVIGIIISICCGASLSEDSKQVMHKYDSEGWINVFTLGVYGIINAKHAMKYIQTEIKEIDDNIHTNDEEIAKRKKVIGNFKVQITKIEQIKKL